MGTNYYWYEKKPCECCGREYEPIHVGKSSAGWHFSLHVYPEDEINTLDDWKTRFNKKGSYIYDEYGDKITKKRMLLIITDREWLNNIGDEDWYLENHAHMGLNGLAAHNVDGRLCIGNGEGTYDYIVGEFC